MIPNNKKIILDFSPCASGKNYYFSEYIKFQYKRKVRLERIKKLKLIFKDENYDV